MSTQELTSLWLQHQEVLKATLLKQTQDLNLTEDLMQEAYLKIVERAEQIPKLYNPSGYFYNLIHRLWMDHFRKNKPLSQEPLDNKTGVNLPLDTNWNHGQLDCLPKFIRQLPEKYQTALELTTFKGWSQKQLATQTGLSFSGAKSRVQRARQMVKQLMEDCCTIEHDVYGNLLDCIPNHRKCKVA